MQPPPIPATYFDGLRPLPRQAALMIDARGLALSVDGGPMFLWDYRSIRLEERGRSRSASIARKAGRAPARCWRSRTWPSPTR